MKLKKGDIIACELEGGCGLKVVVIEASEEADYDVKCCGKDMTPVQIGGEEVWKQYAGESDPDVWKKFAEGEKQE